MNNDLTTQLANSSTYRIQDHIDYSQLVMMLAIFIVIVCYTIYVCKESSTHEGFEEYNDIMQYFHEDPDFDDFMKIYNFRDILIKKYGRKIKFWIWGVYLSNPEFLDQDREEEAITWERGITRALRRIRTQPTTELLECIWSLYFATGDQQYSEIIRRIAVDHNNIKLRDNARWTYRSIMNREWTEPTLGTAVDSDNNQSTDNAANITDEK